MKAVLERWNAAQSILITSHAGIDGDSAGGALALLEAAKRAGKHADYINAEPLPLDLRAIVGIEKLGRPLPEGRTYDLGLIIDTSDADRVGDVWKYFEALPRAVIDHHEGNGMAADVAWIDSKAASVTVMITELLEAAGMTLDAELAYPLFLGLFTDTFSFQQSNADARALRCGARLVEAGAVPFALVGQLLEQKRLQAVRLCGLAATRAAIDGPVTWAWLTRADFESIGADESDTEGIIATLRSIGGVRAAVLFRELEDGRIRVNFRSKDDADVRAVAARFGGGGHRAAAGCTVTGPREKAQAEVLAALREALS